MLTILERNPQLKQSLPPETALVDATEAAQWFYSDNDQEVWHFDTDLYQLTPPAWSTWIEFETPEYTLTPQGVVPWQNNISRIAAHIICVEIPKEEQEFAIPEEALTNFFCAAIMPPALGDLLRKAMKQNNDGSYKEKLIESGIVPRFLLGARIFILEGNQQDAYSFFGTYLTDEGRAYPRTLPSRVLWSYYVQNMIDSGEITLKRGEAIITTTVLPFAFFLSLMNCNNVTLATPSPIHRNRAEWRRINRDGIEPVHYQELKVSGIRKAAETDAQAASGSKRALHQVRSSWAHYGEENRLFGKYVGTYFRPQHVRGTAAAGTVVKQYNLTPHKEK